MIVVRFCFGLTRRKPTEKTLCEIPMQTPKLFKPTWGSLSHSKSKDSGHWASPEMGVPPNHPLINMHVPL